MIQSLMNPNPASSTATPRRLPALAASRVRRGVSAVAIKHIHAHTATSQQRGARRSTVSTPRTHLSNPALMRQHHSIELALEEADGDYLAELQLRRANVSPFFSSTKAPDAIADAIPELELDPSRMPSQRASRQGFSCSDRSLQAIVIPPLSLDFDAGYSDSRSLSRNSSWQDFSLLLDNPAGQSSRGRGHFFPADEDIGSSTDAWDLFLSEHGTAKRVSYMQALKTPTASGLTSSLTSSFPSLVRKEDPKAFSPTHIDKKVLVTENDLKLPLFSHDAFGEPVIRSLDMSDALDWQAHGHVANPQRKRKATMSPPSSPAYARSKREVLFPREPQVQSLDRPKQQPKLKPLACRFAPGNAIQSGMISSARRGSGKDHEPELYTLKVHRLPDLLPDRRSPSSMRAHYPFPLIDSNRKRSLALEHMGNIHSHGAAREQRAPAPAASHVVDGHPELLYVAGFSPGAIFPHASRVPKRKIGIYSPEARRERLRRFHEKRKQRVYAKRINYDCRKRLANACPRVKGRFVRKNESDEATQRLPCAENARDVDASSSVAVGAVEQSECEVPASM